VSSSFCQAVVDIPQVAILKTLRFISGGLLFNMNPYRFEFLGSHRDLNLREFLTDLFKFEHVILLSWTPFSLRSERLKGVHAPVRVG
jgi:hypothetical protein